MALSPTELHFCWDLIKMCLKVYTLCAFAQKIHVISTLLHKEDLEISPYKRKQQQF